MFGIGAVISALVEALGKPIRGTSVVEQPRSYGPSRRLLSYLACARCLLSEVRCSFRRSFTTPAPQKCFLPIHVRAPSLVCRRCPGLLERLAPGVAAVHSAGWSAPVLFS